METKSIKHDKLDSAGWTDTFDQAGRLQDQVTDGYDRLATINDLAEDVYYSMFKYTPRQRGVDDMESTHQLNHQLIENMVDTQEWARLRTHTKLQPFESALATVALVDKLMEEIPESDLDALNTQIKAVEFAEEYAQDLIDRAAKQPAIKKAQGQAARESAKLAKSVAKHGGELRRAMRTAAGEADRQTNEFAETAAGWGLEAGQLQSLPWEEKAELARLLLGSDQLKRIAEIVGRLKRLAIHARNTRVRSVPLEIMDVETGADVSRLLPTELVLLDDPDLEVVFLRKWAEKQLLQYRLDGKEPTGKGPIICAVDESGSMDGERIAWAKGIALALAEVARVEGRQFVGICFGSYNELEVFRLGDGAERVKQLAEFAGHFYCGGTDFDRPLIAAKEAIRGDEPKGDLVFITDGECSVSPSVLDGWRQLAKETEARAIGISVGFDREPESLKSFCNSVYNIADIAGEMRGGNQTAATVFSGLQ